MTEKHHKSNLDAVEARRAEDGSIEFIMDHEPSSQSRHSAATSSTSQPAGASSKLVKIAMIAAPLALLAVVGVGAMLARGGQDNAQNNKDLVSEWSSSLPQRDFKAYDAPKETIAQPLKVAAPAPKRVRPADEDLSPEEREAWRLAESTGQDVVYEDEGSEPEPTNLAASRAPAKPADNPANIYGVDESRRLRPEDARPSPKQIEMLRDFNKRMVEDPEAFRNVKVDSALNKRLRMGLPYKLKPIKQLPINPNPPSGEHQLPKTPNPTYLPDVYGASGKTPGTE